MPRMVSSKRSPTDSIPPPGFQLVRSLRGHDGLINDIAWNPQGTILASCSSDGTICLWKPEASQPLAGRLSGHREQVYSLAWSPTGDELVSASASGEILKWNARDLSHERIHGGFKNIVWKILWSRDGALLCTVEDEGSIRFWSAPDGTLLEHHREIDRQIFCAAWASTSNRIAYGCSNGRVLIRAVKDGTLQKELHSGAEPVRTITWSPGDNYLACGGTSGTIDIWDLVEERVVRRLEGHTARIYSVVFSADGRLLASKADDNTVRLWRCDTWEILAVQEEPTSGIQLVGGLDFRPEHDQTWLTTRGGRDSVLKVWQLDLVTLLEHRFDSTTHCYRNAKVVLVGSTGVGKSGLALVLTGQRFEPTESTHGRKVRVLETSRVLLAAGEIETREVLLWDLAGQRNYNLIHLLHLSEASVVLVVFDPARDSDPFTGVHYWARALAQSGLRSSKLMMGKLLVAARIDRGGVPISRAEIQQKLDEMGFQDFFQTSAKEGTHIAELSQAIRNAIVWTQVPAVSSTVTFQRIKTFIRTESQSGRELVRLDDLYRSYVQTLPEGESANDLYRSFRTCVQLVESLGLIKRLSFGGFLLLRPELLDSYASSIINAARNSQIGQGCLHEQEVLKGNIPIPPDERLQDSAVESIILIAAIEELLRSEIAVKEGGDLIFPSAFIQRRDDLSIVQGRHVVFTFEGPVDKVFATLTVRLYRGGPFETKRLATNTVVFETRLGGRCGISLLELAENRGEITVFFDGKVSQDIRSLFEDFVTAHLIDLDYLSIDFVVICGVCEMEFSKEQVRMRRQRGAREISCPVCEARVSLPDLQGSSSEEVRSPSEAVIEVAQAAERRRKSELNSAIVHGKSATDDYDVFFAYNSKDRSAVLKVYEAIKLQGYLPWIDVYDLRPGSEWILEVPEIIESVNSVAVFVGPHKTGRWENVEIQLVIRQCVEHGATLVPVILPGAEGEPDWSKFVDNFYRVDMREAYGNPIQKIVWGIGGMKPD